MCASDSCRATCSWNKATKNNNNEKKRWRKTERWIVCCCCCVIYLLGGAFSFLYLWAGVHHLPGRWGTAWMRTYQSTDPCRNWTVRSNRSEYLFRCLHRPMPTWMNGRCFWLSIRRPSRKFQSDKMKTGLKRQIIPLTIPSFRVYISVM